MRDDENRGDRGAAGPAHRERLTSRRSFLSGTIMAAGGLAAVRFPRGAWGAHETDAASAPQVTQLPEGKDPNSFIQHSPLTFETKREAFGTSGVVPYERLFVRNNLPTPDASYVEDRDGWELAVEGVRNPRGLSIRELEHLGIETVATVLQCSGNGRAFFPHDTSGSQWGVGAAGCVIWSGVPVRAVVEALGGAEQGARFVTGTGGEALPEGLDRSQVVVERSIPIAKGMEDALLAWEMNGEPLPLAHGGPLRLVVPGYFGINQVKYVKRLALTAKESDAAIMRTGYRFRPIGEDGNPSQPSMWEMRVKSWINHPGGDDILQANRAVIIDGVAFGGTRPVHRVDVSMDGGRSWREAPLFGPDLGPYAWRQFALPVTLEAGTHTIASRATDDAGNTQPAERVENHRGYGNTSWRDHAVTITLT